MYTIADDPTRELQFWSLATNAKLEDSDVQITWVPQPQSVATSHYGIALMDASSQPRSFGSKTTTINTIESHACVM